MGSFGPQEQGATEEEEQCLPLPRGTGTCQAGPAVQTPAFKIAMKGWGPARGQ